MPSHTYEVRETTNGIEDRSAETRRRSGSKTCHKKKEKTLFFEKRTCVKFIPSVRDPASCSCGRREEDHEPETARSEPGTEIKWDVNIHTKLVPTDAYGELEFTGAGRTSRAKYVRIEHNTKSERVIQLMLKEWKLNKPKLLISVTGGAKDFVLHPKLKQMLKRGLLKAAQTTSAWIITGGTNTGVMRHVGEAVTGHAVMSRGAQFKAKSNLHLIGIATWGIVNQKELLVDNKDIATYHMTSSMTSQGACLDNNHSNFILVDDGTEGKYGGEIAFRARLENYISQQKITIEKSNGVPVVLLVLEGGPNTIKTVLASVTSNPAVPVVIAEGSGRAADILAFAHHVIIENDGTVMDNVPEVVEHGQILLKIMKAFPGASEQECIQLYHDVITCVDKQKYITIFRVDEDGIDIDKAMLKALLKAQHTKAAEQLSLALIWDRVDIAKSVIFTEGQKWEDGDLENAMMDALLKGRVDFVKLLLEHGVSMASFLTEARLTDLYRKKAETSIFIRRIIGEGKQAECGRTILCKVERAVGRMLGGSYNIQTTGRGTIARGIFLANFQMSTKWNRNQMMNVNNVKFPFNELLVWSVLCKMQELALFMWESGDENMSKALVAAKLYKSLAKKIVHDEANVGVLNELHSHAREFQDIALGLLDECYQTNQVLAHQLLTYNLEYWGNQTCMYLAVVTEHEKFLAHTCCQTLLTDIWMGAIKLSKSSWLKVIAGLLLPPSILFLKFKNREELSYMPTTYEDYERGQESEEQDSSDDEERTENIELRPFSVYNKTGSEASFNMRRINRETSLDDYQLAINFRRGNRFVEFYGAPITKFWANVIAYMAFLALFSYVILVKQRSILDIPEIVLIVFVCTLLTEEIRQILHSEPSRFKYKLKTWASSNWNLLDGLAMALFFLGMGLRLNNSTAGAGHVVYCFDLTLWIIRLLDIFSVSKYMGPYVVMIGRMTVDMAYFLLIMVIFMLAYGIAQQAILHPQGTPSLKLLSQIFFRPYFQIYGELFLEDPEKDDANTTIFGTEVFDPFGGTLVAFLMAFYLLVANILLLNLLIAIFNNTYSKVEANSLQIWKYQRYYLVMEYAQRPLLVPPFIIFNHMVHLVKGIYKRLRKCCNKLESQGFTSDHRLKLFLEKEDLHNLILFEEQCLDSYLTNKNSLLHATWEERVRVIEERTDSISTQLQEISKENSRQAQLEEQHKSMLELLKRLQVPGPLGRTPSKSVMKAAGVLRGLSQIDKSRDAVLNVKARLSPYPKSEQQRIQVPDNQVDWKVSCPDYNPPRYTSETVQARPPWADPDILINQEGTIKFNCMDTENRVDRRSHTGMYEVIGNLPRNPIGRTGIIGRGLLGRWGPNHAADPIVTRWKIGPDGEEMQRGNKGVLEFVSIQRQDNKEWAIPGGMVEPGDSVSKTLRKEFCEEALSSLDASPEERLQMTAIMNKFFKHGIVVYKGYVDDPRNTDNAWMETVAMNFHDNTGKILGNINLKAGDDARGVQWQEVSGHTPLYASHASMLRRVAELRGAFF